MAEDIKYCHVMADQEHSFYYDHVHIVWDEQITLHQSPSWELSYVIKGSGTRIVGDTMETFSNGEIVFIPPDMPHGWYFDQYDHDEDVKIENITIAFTDTLLKNFADNFVETRKVVTQIQEYNQAVKFEGYALCCLQQIMTDMRMQNNMGRLASLLTIFSLISLAEETKVVGNFNKSLNKSALKLQEVSRYIVHNYHRKITLDEVAQYIGMNRSSFCTFFQREKGKSFFTALNEYRIDCSCLMLLKTRKPIADICYAVGFEDVPYYNRTFKKMKGESPKDYRARYQTISI